MSYRLNYACQLIAANVTEFVILQDIRTYTSLDKTRIYKAVR